MKNKIKEFFRIVFSEKKTKVMFCFAVMSLLLLITVTFAWFISIIDLPTSTIKTGNLSFVAKGYDENGDFISTIIGNEEYNKDDPDMININAPLFEIDNWTTNSATTSYISIENSGSIDLEYALTFTVNGNENDLENMGGFWYRIERLDNSKLTYSLGTYLDGTTLKPGYNPKCAYYDNVIKDYLTTASSVILCGDDCIKDDGYYEHICTEFNSLSRNLVTIDHLAEYGKLELEKENICIYRIDVGFRKEAIEQRYTNISLDISGEIYATQPGAILNPDGLGATITVTDEVTLNNALENALPGDTIVLGNKINYNGDLIINKCVSINTYGNDLVVNGNFIYNYISEHTLKLNLSSGGNIYVVSNGAAGGNFQINAPNSEVLITGNNYKTNIYVEKDAIFRATNAPSTKGLLLSGANIYNKDGDPKDIDIESNTRLTLDYGGSLSFIEAVNNATNIEIVNYGTIGTINLAKMLLVDSYPELPTVDTEYPQIYVDNYNKITNAIQLPDWSTPYREFENTDGYKEGNTLIIREWGAYEMSVLESLCVYKTQDIKDLNLKEVCVIPEVDGRVDSLIVYYGDREGEDVTLESLLKEFFEEYYDTSGLVIDDAINSIRRLVIYSVKEKVLTTTDLAFMKEMRVLADIDMYKAIIQDNTIPANAFKDKSTLAKIVLPDTLTTIQTSAFSNTGLRDISIPESVTYWDYRAFSGITYIFLNSVTVSKSSNQDQYRYHGDYKNHYLIVEESLISDYVAAYGSTFTDTYTPYGGVSGNNRFFAKGVITDDGQHLVRQTPTGYEMLCYTGDSIDIKAGYNLYLNGEEINITSIGPYCYSNVPQAFDISFNNSITQIDNRAFFNSKVRNIDFSNVRYIGQYAFYACDNITYLDTKRVEEIDSYGFASCMNLFSADLPNVLYLRSWAFSKCRYIAQITFKKLQFLGANVFNHKQSNTGDVFHFMVRAYFLNDSFDGVSYSSFVNVKNSQFKCFVKEYLVDDFIGTGCVASNLVYPYGNIVGEYNHERTANIAGDTVTSSINLGEFVICGTPDNAKFVCYNVPNISEDYEMPSIVTVTEIDGSIVDKKITSVCSYAFSGVMIDKIKFTFPDTCETLEPYVFYGHVSYDYWENLSITSFYNNIYEIDLGGVKSIGANCFDGLLKLEKINFDNKVEFIDSYAFRRCDKLFRVEFPNLKEMNCAHVFRNCKELVSIIFGPDLKKITGTSMISGSLPELREIEFQVTSLDGLSYSSDMIYKEYKSTILKVYIHHELINEAVFAEFASYSRELGRRYGEYNLTNVEGTQTYNIGEYVIRDAIVDATSGISICSYNVESTDMPSDYETPVDFDSVPVIRFGQRSYYNVDFTLINSLNASGENFKIDSNILEIGRYAFSDTAIRISEFNNVKYIYDSAFYNCDNIYIVKAPNLVYAGTSAFQGCDYISLFDAKNLVEIGANTLNLTRAREVYTNIKVAKDYTFMGNRVKVVTMATGATDDISGFTPNQTATRCLLTSAKVVSRFTNSHYNVKDINNYMFVNPYDYKVYDIDENHIYTYPSYEYIINTVGDVTIAKCLLDDFTSDYYMPSMLDGRPVVSTTYMSYGYINFNDNKIFLPDSLLTIGGYSFYSAKINGEQNLNKVKSIGEYGFSYATITSLVAPNVTTISGSAFAGCSSLSSITLNSMTSSNTTSFRDVASLNYIYLDNPFTFAINTFLNSKRTDVTVVYNYKASSETDIPSAYWSQFSNVSMYVPYESLDVYKAKFETATYNNFKVYPIGTIISEYNENTGLTDTFVLKEIKGTYNAVTGEFERAFEVSSILSENSSIVIPDSCVILNDEGEEISLNIIRISEYAFRNQDGLTEITLPKYFSSYHDLAFTYAINLENIYVSSENMNYESVDGVLYTKGTKDLVYYPQGHEGSEYSVISGTEVIRSYAFYNVNTLINVNIPDTVGIIGINAFEETNLNSLTFGASNPPLVAGIELFNNSSENVTIYVPAGSVTNYQNSNVFANLKILEKTE